MAERTNAGHVLLLKTSKELRPCGAQQRQIALHAAGHVEHHDQLDRLRSIVEQSDRLRLALVAHLEFVLCQGRHQPTIAVDHGDEDTDDVAAAAEDGLLEPGRGHGGNDAGGQRHTRQQPFH